MVPSHVPFNWHPPNAREASWDGVVFAWTRPAALPLDLSEVSGRGVFLWVGRESTLPREVGPITCRQGDSLPPRRSCTVCCPARSWGLNWRVVGVGAETAGLARELFKTLHLGSLLASSPAIAL